MPSSRFGGASRPERGPRTSWSRCTGSAGAAASTSTANHRAVAAHLAPGRDPGLALWAPTGPVREDILPDLRHYSPPG